MSLESSTYGRVSEGEGETWTAKRDPEKENALPPQAELGLRVLIICNSTAGEIGSEKRSPFLKLQNLLFNLIAPRVQNSYKNQLFFNDSENHLKSSLRTSSNKNFKNDSKNNEILKSIVFFESLENSKTSVKPI